MVLSYLPYSSVLNCSGGYNKMVLRAKSKNNASKTKKCIGEGHKKVQNQENDPPLQLGTKE